MDNKAAISDREEEGEVAETRPDDERHSTCSGADSRTRVQSRRCKERAQRRRKLESDVRSGSARQERGEGEQEREEYLSRLDIPSFNAEVDERTVDGRRPDFYHSQHRYILPKDPRKRHVDSPDLRQSRGSICHQNVGTWAASKGYGYNNIRHDTPLWEGRHIASKAAHLILRRHTQRISRHNLLQPAHFSAARNPAPHPPVMTVEELGSICVIEGDRKH
ncbi:hypothetical protein R3P38DRAFT_2810569 [Favolaschia claudopus]|uniref:Uncharacterized protein n=1 Tax=Favolaschia claudopus TaxID=2862362 RepID=A0AAV9ZAG1_9AGAR